MQELLSRLNAMDSTLQQMHAEQVTDGADASTLEFLRGKLAGVRAAIILAEELIGEDE